MTWCWPGAERNATAAALLRDATGEEADGDLANAFARDVLDHHGGARPFVIAVREIVAWLADREAEVRAQRLTAAVPATLPEMLAARDAELRGGTRSHWLAVFRTIHGPPDVPVYRPAGSPANQRPREEQR